jgi:hypothetical protein
MASEVRRAPFSTIECKVRGHKVYLRMSTRKGRNGVLRCPLGSGSGVDGPSPIGFGVTVKTIPRKLQPVSRYVKAGRRPTQPFDVGRGNMPGNVGHRTAGEATDMMVGIRSSVVPSRAIAETQLASQTATHKGLETLVNGGQGDPGHLVSNVKKDFVGRRVFRAVDQEPIHGSPLLSEPVSVGFEGLTEDGLACIV